MDNIRKFGIGIKIEPKTPLTADTQGELEVDSSDGKLNYHDGSSESPIVTETSTATLTNKTISGNTASNLINGSGEIDFNSSGTITVPNATDTLIGKATTDTLTNKTLTSPVINSPTGIVKGDVGLGNVDNTSDATKNAAAVTLTNKTLDNTNSLTIKDTNFTIQDDGDTSKQVKFQASNISNSTTRTLTIPDADTTIVGTDATQTLTNKVLSGNTAVTLISGSGTLTLNTIGTITIPNATDTLVAKATTDTLTNKTLIDNSTIIADNSDNTKQIKFDAGGTTLTSTTITAAQTANRVLTLPNATTTLVGTDTTDALSNKTSIAVDNLLLDLNTISSTDTNGNIVLDPNGTGFIDVQSNLTSTGNLKANVYLQLKEAGGGTDTISIQAPVLASSYILTLPTTNGLLNQTMISDGAGVLSWTTVATAPVAPTVQKFTTGSGTYTTPTSPAPLYIRVRMVGAGGGAAGSGTTGQANGSAGGNTTFGSSLLVANGGGGTTTTNAPGGAGGTASLGSGPVGIAVTGGGGQACGNAAPEGGGQGGCSMFGGGGKGTGPGGAATTGQTGSVGGGGGGTSTSTGAAAASAGGGAGGGVDAIIYTPSATYAYAVGTGGSGGSGGTNGFTGGAGGSGLILVEEYYQ